MATPIGCFYRYNGKDYSREEFNELVRKELEEKRGTKELIDEDIKKAEQRTFKLETKLTKQKGYSNSEVISARSRIKAYNARYGTSHGVDFTQQGQADRFDITGYNISFNPVNRVAQITREQARLGDSAADIDKNNQLEQEKKNLQGGQLEMFQKIDNEFGEKYWKDQYTNLHLSNVYDFRDVVIPTIKNKFAPDYDNVYHGTNNYKVDADGNLVLIPSKNFDDRTSSISLTQIPVVAQDYMLRKGGNTIIKIKNSALPSDFTVESAEEIALNRTEPFIVTKGDYQIITVPTIAEKMKLKYANEVENRAENMREKAKSSVELLDSIYSMQISADNASEYAEYSNEAEGLSLIHI